MNGWPYLFTRSPIPGVALFQPELEFTISSASAENRAQPIGRVMEDRFANALQASGQYEILARGIQVRAQKQTIGELDFLLRDGLGDIWHVEFAYKLFLHRDTAPGADMNSWVGPAGRDRLALKVNKMADKQFPLLFAPDTGVLLDALDIEARSVKQGIAIAGELYLSEGEQPTAVAPLAPGSMRGRWYFEGKQPRQPCAVLDKPQWIDPVRAVQVMPWPRAEALLTERLQHKGHALCADASGARWFVLTDA